MRWPQPLVASGGRDLNLPGLAAMGVTLLGRLESADRDRFVLDNSLTGNVSYSDEFSGRICAQIDAYIEAAGIDAPAATEESRAGPVEDAGPSVLDFAAAGITSVIWCSGFTGDFSYLPAAVLDEGGQPRHDGVLTPVPGLFLVGVPWLVRRDSGILHGMPADAETAAASVIAHLAGPATG
jgi:putative flavoprotein involved in K+ transport